MASTGLLAGAALELVQQHRDRALLEPLRREVEKGMSLGRRNAEEKCHQGLRFADLVESLREQGLELLELVFGTIVARESGRSLEPGDNRMKCRIGVMLRTVWRATCMGRQAVRETL